MSSLIIEGKQPISLGELIDLLAARPQDNRLQFDFGYMAPTGVSSYRGYYDHLAIEYEDGRYDVTVAAFLKQLTDAVGAVFEGYKGGDFRMHRGTPLWVANCGNSGGTCVVGAYVTDYATYLATGYCEDWAGSERRAYQVLAGLGFGNAHLPSPELFNPVLEPTEP